MLRVMLLPRRVWHTEKSDGIDLSGLANQEGQLTPYAMPRWEHGSTDEMRLVRKRVVMSGSGNTPTLNGRVEALDYVESIVAGFTRIYRLLQQHRFCCRMTGPWPPLPMMKFGSFFALRKPTPPCCVRVITPTPCEMVSTEIACSIGSGSHRRHPIYAAVDRRRT